MTLSPGNSSREEHSSQKEGKKISSANLAIENTLFRGKDIKTLLLLFPDTRCSEEPREQHSAFFY
jgi:hypothetical protein